MIIGFINLFCLIDYVMIVHGCAWDYFSYISFAKYAFTFNGSCILNLKHGLFRKLFLLKPTKEVVPKLT